jgi:hypothetical protein
MAKRTLAIFALSCAFIVVAIPRSSGQPTAPVKGRHVILIVLENENFALVASDPYFAHLKTRGMWFSNSQAVTHPSYPNYLALVTGDTFGVHNDHQKNFHDPDPKRYATIADLLEANGLTWKSYAQGYPGAPGKCFIDSDETQTLYARKHVPLLSFKAITDTARCDSVVNAESAFDTFVASGRLADLKKTLPNFAFYTPNMNNDGHNTNLATASKWLRGVLAPLLDNAEFMRDLVIILTFDESADHQGANNNHIFTAMFGPMIKPGEDKTRINHYTMLRTIESIFLLNSLTANDHGEAPIPIKW